MATAVVADASAVVGQFMPSGSLLPADFELHVPTVVDYEVVAAIRRNLRLGLLSNVQADDAIDTWNLLRLTRHDAMHLTTRMWALRENFTADDAAYVALAEALDLPLVTSDLRLAHAAEPYCRVIVPG
jgi:predicted nucleic acid-binding protein